jgi:hypothetical protein
VGLDVEDRMVELPMGVVDMSTGTVIDTRVAGY